jgi:hypothetical protein
MADATADRSITTAAPDLLDLVALVLDHASAHDMTATAVVARLHSLVSNNPPPDDADDGDAHGNVWLAMSRRQREDLRRVNQRRVEQTAPASDAAASVWLEGKRSATLAEIERNVILPRPLQELLADALIARNLYSAGMSASVTTLQWLRAATRVLEPLAAKLKVPSPFDHIYAVCHAIEAAIGGNMRPFGQVLPLRDPKAGHPTGSTPEDQCKALIAGAVVGLLLGGEKAGGFKNAHQAGREIHQLLIAEDVAIAEQTPRQHYGALSKIVAKSAASRSQRETDMLEIYRVVEASARLHLKRGPWPREARLAWAALIAAKAAIL